MTEEITFTQEDIQEMINEGNQSKRDYISFGLLSPFSENLEDVMNTGIKYQFDFVVANIFNSKGVHNINTTEYIMNSESWSNSLVGIVTKDDIKKQIEWGCYLSLPALLFSLDFDLDQLSHVLNQTLDSVNSCWIHVKSHQWKEWNFVRNMCDYHPKLYVMLDFPVDLPDDAWELQRWMSEPLKAITVSGDMFLNDSNGNVRTTDKHLSCLEKFLDFPLQIVLRDKIEDPISIKNYLSDFYHSREMPEHEEATKSFHDVLQFPLQPLMHNLESASYEVFEMDSKKYDQYEQAIYKAILDQPEKDCILIYVLGAGRGGLVKRAIRASRKSKRTTRILALEKNQNAINILLHFKKVIWENNVEIVHSDMRDYEGDQGDIIVSELLGSFGDNELSPECLDGAKHLYRKDTVFIPCEYTSYCALLSSNKLFRNVRAYNSKTSFETPYVVKVHQHNLMSEIIECFKFRHPSEIKKHDRYKKMEFTVKNHGVVHGIIGYFEAQLYKDVWLSIHPLTHESLNSGMFSWFPLVFPIQTPLSVSKSEKINVNMWRCCNKYKVWYEWNLHNNKDSHVFTHNVNGRSSWVGIL